MNRTILVMLSVVSCAASTALGGASFQGLGDLPGGTFESIAYGVSADGSVVVGRSVSTDGQEAFIWTAAGGMVGLGDLPDGSFGSWATGASADGRVIVGTAHSASGEEAFRWTAGGMVGLGDLPGGSYQSQAKAVSADGAVIVGGSSSVAGYSEGFRWTVGTGLVPLGYLPGGGRYSQATGVSADGSVVVGCTDDVYRMARAYKWTEATGMISLGLPPGDPYIRPYAYGGVSADGLVVAGEMQMESPPGSEAFRWTEPGYWDGLGDLPGGALDSIAFGISGDGSVIVGKGATTAGSVNSLAFIWDATNGMRNLRDVLIDECGLDLSGWPELHYAYAVSADGKTIVGHGINPAGQTEAWVATIPEPGTLGLLAFGGLALIRRTRSRTSTA